jgi:hypothetical protein
VQSGNWISLIGGGPAAADIVQLAVGEGGGGVMAKAWTELAKLKAGARADSVPPAARVAGFAAANASFGLELDGNAAAAVVDEQQLGLGKFTSELLDTVYLDGLPSLEHYLQAVGAPAIACWSVARGDAAAAASSCVARVQTGLSLSAVQEWAAALSAVKGGVISNCGLRFTFAGDFTTAHQCAETLSPLSVRPSLCCTLTVVIVAIHGLEWNCAVLCKCVAPSALSFAPSALPALHKPHLSDLRTAKAALPPTPRCRGLCCRVHAGPAQACQTGAGVGRPADDDQGGAMEIEGKMG